MTVHAIATRVEGEALANMEKVKGASEPGTERGKRRGSTQRPREVAGPITLKELGTTKSEASRAQRIAGIPDDDLQEHFAEVERNGEITTAGVLRLAAKQETRKTKDHEARQEDRWRTIRSIVLVPMVSELVTIR